MIKIHKKNRGVALITLLFFSVMALMITTTAVAIISTGSIATANVEQEEVAYYTAESGIENALLRLLRDPNYTGESLLINGGTTTIQIDGSNPYTITSTSTIGNIKHTIEVGVNYSNNVLSITSWEQLY